MTENEKLRALLAEARESVEADASFCVALMPDGTSRSLAGLLACIDAALAEPVQGCTRCEETEHQMHLRIRASYDKTIADSWRAKVAEVERECDELRAEVKRLQKGRQLSEDQISVECLREDAFQRGAEAMREAAAQMFDRESAAWGDRLGGVMPKHHANSIRALPIPEDKP